MTVWYYLLVGWLIKDIAMAIEMDAKELREMYTEYCMERGVQISPESFDEFKEWHMRVLKYFEKGSDSA